MLPTAKVPTVLLAAGVLAVPATPSFACRMFSPQPELLEDYPERVSVRVQSAQSVDNPGWQTWSLTAEPLEPPAIGEPTAYTFRTTLYSDGCGPTPLPSVGEIWTLYFEADSSEVRLAHPRFWLEERQAEQIEEE